METNNWSGSGWGFSSQPCEVVSRAAELIWEWGGGRTSGSGHNSSDSLSIVGFILNLCIMRYADFPPQFRHTANPEAKDPWSLLFRMKWLEEVDFRAAGSDSDDRDRVIWLLALDWIWQAINILICLRGQCVIRYIDRLSCSKDLQPELNFASLFPAWTILVLSLVGNLILMMMWSVNSQLHGCIGGGTYQKVDHWTTRHNDFLRCTIKIPALGLRMKWNGELAILSLTGSHDQCQHMNWPHLQGRSSDLYSGHSKGQWLRHFLKPTLETSQPGPHPPYWLPLPQYSNYATILFATICTSLLTYHLPHSYRHCRCHSISF